MNTESITVRIYHIKHIGHESLFWCDSLQEWTSPHHATGYLEHEHDLVTLPPDGEWLDGGDAELTFTKN